MTMGVAFTAYSLSEPMSEDEARTIARRPELFGYVPDVLPLRGAWHLSLCSKGDHETVARELTAMRAGKVSVAR